MFFNKQTSRIRRFCSNIKKYSLAIPQYLWVFNLLLIMKAKRMIFIVLISALSYLSIFMISPCSPSLMPHRLGAANPLLIYSLAVDGQKKFNSTRVRLNRERYVKLHEGIEYFHQTEKDPSTRLLAWQKIKDYRKVKGGHEWVWLLDSDAFIMNGETSGLAVIRSQLALEAKKNTRQIDIIICKDLNGLNSGSLFIRNSAWTDNSIDRWLSYENDTTITKVKEYVGVYEQPAFIYMYKFNELNLRDHVSIIEQRKINSYHNHYKVGDYVLHFAGFGYARLVKWLEEKGLVEV
jgi:hypothetical protein